MRKTMHLTIMLFILFQIGFAKEPSFLQYFFTVKNVLPETKNIGIFISEKQYKAQEKQIKRASAQTGIKALVFIIADARSIGKSIKELNSSDALVVCNSPILEKKSSRIFILSKTKDKKIPVITASKEYSDSGALLCLGKDENHRTQIILNLKQTDYLASKFTDESVQKLGISKIIR